MGLVAAVLFLNPLVASADEQRQEKWHDEKSEMTQSQENGKSSLLYDKDGKKRWRIYGKTGYEYDDNVRLHSNKPFPRKEGLDASAGRYTIQSGLAYKMYKDEKYEADLFYRYTLSLHDDSLNEFNFQDHIVGVYGKRKFTMWGRPSYVSARYHFDHGMKDGDTHNSSNALSFAWVGEWAENWQLTVYERLAWKNFRNKGFNPDDTSRDGFYHRTGFLQKYFFEMFDRKSEVNFGYEFGFNVTEGNRFDRISNGLRVGFETRLIEKIFFETNLFWQSRYYHHYPGDPDRHDIHWKHEYILKRDLTKNIRLETFYRRTDVNNLHDGVQGRFNYNRNIYGFELKYAY